MLTVSVCTIVKNEAKAIPGFIKTIKDIADELIVVDTGSSDNTVELITSLAKNYNLRFSILNYQYTGSFHYPRAKNFSISKATSDYIFVLDADERLSRGFIKNFKKYLEGEKPLVAKIVRADELVRQVMDNPIRIIKNGQNLYYDDVENERVHEKMTINAKFDVFEPVVWHCQRYNHWLQNPPRMLYQLQIAADAEKKTASLFWHFLRGIRGFFAKFSKLYLKRKLYRDGKNGFKFSFLRSLESLWAQIMIGLKPRPNYLYWEHLPDFSNDEDGFDYE